MNHLKPLHYHITLTPDLDTFTFTGSCTIHFHPQSDTDRVLLNSLDLDIRSCMIQSALHGNNESLACNWTLDTKKEELVITLPRPYQGKFLLTITYTGEINNTMAGFYRSSYKADGELRYIGVTQFEESDARRAFPCVDHPLYKARCTIEMIINKELQGISNEDIEKEESLPGNKKRIIFKQTPKTSTYLLFFGVGTFDKKVHSGDPRIRLYTVPGKIKQGEYGLDFGQKALDYCETYYGIPYPLSKMDLIAVPDFAFGAMENWGAVTFRENLLLYYPGITSRHGERRICEVIAHETVHMWFGNLVTPTDWKFLWLNESFATLFGFSVVDHYHPEWEIWDQFIYEETTEALERDSLVETIAIEIPGGEHVVINTSTAPIIYSKGGSVLRQMKEYIGESAFKKGLHHYLQTHAYGNTTSTDFWKAFEETSDVPVVDLMKTWIEQPGHPIIKAKRHENTLVLEQECFSHIQQSNTSADRIWHIPLTIRFFYNNNTHEDKKILFKDKKTTLDLDAAVTSYKINPGQTGFYRVHYLDTDNLEKLKDRISRKQLSPRDRWGCEYDLYGLVKACTVLFRDYLEFLGGFKNEDAYLPLMSIGDNLIHSFLVLSPSWEEKIKHMGVRLFESALSVIGYEPGDNEPFTTSLLRSSLLFKALFFGSGRAREFCLTQFNRIAENKQVHPDILASVMQGGAFLEPDKAWDILIRRFETTESEHDRINVLSGLSSFSHKEYVNKALEYILEKVPSRNKYIGLAHMTANPAAIPSLWKWYCKHIDSLEKLHPVHYERIVAAFIPMCGIERESEVKTFFKEYSKNKDLAKQAIELSLEWLAVHIQMRKKNG